MLSILSPTRIAALALMVTALGPGRSGMAGSMQTSLALGDSMAFGETDFTQNPSNGDRGYVSGYANWLGTQGGGVRPCRCRDQDFDYKPFSCSP